ncbi:tetratricopeptide repeat protein [Dongia sp.]|uniref:tetratricopeptide repeat protein n=1 Tax=Dongia sp. TaxID=1977262 RepID=UPI0035B2997C
MEFMIWKIWGESGIPQVDALVTEGEAAMGADDFETAEQRFDAAIQERPDFAEAWNKRATLHYLAGQYQKSLDDIQKVLELEPRHFGALSGLGLVNLALSRDAAARDAFERVLVLYPANQAARFNLQEIEKRLRENEI